MSRLEKLKKDIEEIEEMLQLEKKHKELSFYEQYSEKYSKFLKEEKPFFRNPFEKNNNVSWCLNKIKESDIKKYKLAGGCVV